MALPGELLLPLSFIGLALLIIAATAIAAIWDGRRNRPRAELGLRELSDRIAILPDFAKGEFTAMLDDARTLLAQKRYRECMKRSAEAVKGITELMEVVRQGRAELRSIETKVEELRSRGLVIDRHAVGLDSVSRFWGEGR